MTSPSLPRSEWLHLLRTALDVGAWDFARLAADAYLENVPRDLEVRLLKAEALLRLGAVEQARTLAQTVALADPEMPAAHRLRWQALSPTADEAQRAAILGALAALDTLPPNETPPAWGTALRQTYTALDSGDTTAAQAALFPALPGHGHIPILAVGHLRLVWAQGDWTATLHLARLYHQRWPQTLAFRLVLAHLLAESGQETQSVAMLHAAAADDPAGQVLRRLFGEDHPYRALWPRALAAPLEIPLPAAVAAALGRNRLPAAPRTATASKQPARPAPPAEAPPEAQAAPPPQPETPPSPPEDTPEDAPQTTEPPSSASTPPPGESAPHPAAQRRSQPRRTAAAERILTQAARRLKAEHLTRAEGRFPVYVILSTRAGLEARYGQDTTRILIRHMEQVAQAVTAHPRWESLVLLADDPASARAHGIKPVPPSDPWALKKQLAALDAALGRKGSMIGALLIVGGGEVVPFHRLPNPIEDDDDVVLSDNPYGALDENYLAPTWPVGRLPGSADGDATLLLTALRNIAAEHRAHHHPHPWYRRWWASLRGWLPFTRPRPRSLGYSAAVWEKAAHAVFRTIGGKHDLLTSPPLHAEALAPLPKSTWAYFNLHGLPESSVWYGQRAAADAGQPDYPVALRPEDIPNHGRAPQVVFSEACYGAYLHDKTPASALSLRFLYTGTAAFVGSTVTAYGGVDTPLSAADLLGHLFWQRLKAGLPAGEALRQAKFLFAREIHHRFGFLDGEDQKTLTAFVLYGDPLHRPLQKRASEGKGILRPKQAPHLRTAEEHPIGEDTLPPRMSKRVKAIVQTYLPGENGLEVLLAEQRVASAAKGQAEGRPRVARKVVVVSKRHPAGHLAHRHYVRVAMDAHGKVVKITVSR